MLRLRPRSIRNEKFVEGLKFAIEDMRLERGDPCSLENIDMRSHIQFAPIMSQQNECKDAE